jgi:hypothetical protein
LFRARRAACGPKPRPRAARQYYAIIKHETMIAPGGSAVN